ncbi:hypothetical protein [Cyanobium sp. NIES-981]|uniref:hypothetical protein n=1 Tax=Cyanobium sp. NIES-981 TaxID=1851505 RepID=UPI0012FC388E|nr:hypothetical protein [Cyanobium sp. NIES-981]
MGRLSYVEKSIRKITVAGRSEGETTSGGGSSVKIGDTADDITFTNRKDAIGIRYGDWPVVDLETILNRILTCNLLKGVESEIGHGDEVKNGLTPG